MCCDVFDYGCTPDDAVSCADDGGLRLRQVSAVYIKECPEGMGEKRVI